jgi:hypothetical protein
MVQNSGHTGYHLCTTFVVGKWHFKHLKVKIFRHVLVKIRVCLRSGRPGDPGRGKMIFPLAFVSRSALGPIQPPVQWVPGVLSKGLKHGRGATLTTHPHLVLRSRMSRSYTSSPPSASVACSGTALVSFSM